MDKIVEQIANGSITIDSHSAEYIARLWFINQMIGAFFVTVVTILTIWGIRTVWKKVKEDW